MEHLIIHTGVFDFEELSLTVQLNQTHRSTCFIVSTIDNILAETTETFTVKATVLQDPFSALILEPNVSTVTIMDNDSELFSWWRRRGGDIATYSCYYNLVHLSDIQTSTY